MTTIGCAQSDLSILKFVETKDVFAMRAISLEWRKIADDDENWKWRVSFKFLRVARSIFANYLKVRRAIGHIEDFDEKSAAQLKDIFDRSLRNVYLEAFANIRVSSLLRLLGPYIGERDRKSLILSSCYLCLASDWIVERWQNMKCHGTESDIDSNEGHFKSIELEGAIDISLFRDPSVDVENSIKAPLASIASTARRRLDCHRDDTKSLNNFDRCHQIIRAINYALYEDFGFRKCPAEKYYESENSFIDIVLRRKRAIPILSCLVWKIVADELDLDCWLLSQIPCHLMIRVSVDGEDDAERRDIFVDAYNSGTTYSRKGLDDFFVTNFQIGIKNSMLTNHGPRSFYERMLGNIMGNVLRSARSRGEEETEFVVFALGVQLIHLNIDAVVDGSMFDLSNSHRLVAIYVNTVVPHLCKMLAWKKWPLVESHRILLQLLFDHVGFRTRSGEFFKRLLTENAVLPGLLRAIPTAMRASIGGKMAESPDSHPLLRGGGG